ncbi:MAG: NAD(P)/FAD-dependent oxidoreductase [Gammaproteobacteria bacterium]|jgi:NAD(P)H-nitrite reductase large subunit|nr:NAD(P)/FAD-dependent oxidoreductase [Gammaproteobacteria bacterium]MBT3725955.1 NAD(P)/FAD-dependent oxidoreductase [Gammaproteobacteria bacterium]MBT4077202.1 NAD(P)/FAD-dependent oxidoreductase [Gammaproteobacteria bacterium]MBT4193127.1 NAD(P)/FAD-dependent oxidoreductase [Gammaproteobacteria bacterium]MBT4450262.1 NAD(P)/FAD-dependent oxidoreductase [Gammaproteobacteria bacterium]
MHYIVIGAGPAGVVAAETLRKNDQHADITIIGAEPEPPYSRMAIPYFLEGKIEQEGSYLRDPSSHFSSLKIDVIQDIVNNVDTAEQLLTLNSGSTLQFDKLLIATGSRPLAPPIPGTDLDIVHSCWTLEDARKIIELAQPGSNVILIGAGFIGCIILESLLKRGINLTIVETGNRMVPRMLNDKAGGLIKSWCIEKGIDVKTSCGVESIIRNTEGLVGVKLSDGSQLAADLVITATGVKPNTEFLENSEIQIDKGLLVNEYMQTSDSNVYAAGDVAQALDFSTGNHEVQAIQTTSTDHGRIAALNMCGKKVQHEGSINMNVLDTVGLISCSFGLWMGVEDGESVEIYNEKDYRYLNLQFDGDILVGASSTGMTQHIGVLRGLIESRLQLGVWKDRLLKDPTLIMEAYMANTQELG